MAEVDLDLVLSVARNAAIGAGKMILEADSRRQAGQTLRVEGKGGVDLVTETDQQCEQYIIDAIKRSFPDHCFVGEESSFLEAATLTDAPTWVIDPLDGTTNYVHGYPLVTVSIGFTLNKVPVAGVIHNPFLGHTYDAVQGKGAFRNGTRLLCTQAQHVGEALIVNNIGASRDHGFIDLTLHRLRFLMSHAPPLQGLRNSGSAAQNMAQVAAGQLDAYFEDGYGGPWDVAAGYILIKEAGGTVVDPLSGAPYELVMGKGRILCGSAPLCRDVVSILNAADADARRHNGGATARLLAAFALGAACTYLLWRRSTLRNT